MSTPRTHWPTELPTLVVLGAGVPGKDLAVAGVRFGHTVRLADADEEALQDARRHVEKRLKRFEQHGQLHAPAGDLLERLSVSTDVAAALDGADVVVEATTGAEAARQEALAEAHKVAPDALVLSDVGTGSLASGLGGTEPGPRVAGVHFFSPAAALPFAEVVAGPNAGEGTLDEAARVCVGLGRDVARLASDGPGLVATRLQTRLLVSCAAAADAGDLHAIDAGFRSLGFSMGPFEVMDMAGLDRIEAQVRALFDDVPAPLAERVAAGNLGRRTGEGWFTSDGPARDAEPADVVSLLAPTLVEAAGLVAQGVADAGTIDRALRLGAGFPGGAFALARALGVEQVAKAGEAQGLDAAPLTSLELPPPHTGIETAESAGVTLVRFAGGHNGNRVDDDLAEAFRTAVDAAEGPVVVAGEGRFFCHPQTGPLPESVLEPLRLKPTVALLHGPLGDGAMTIARACRRRVARSDAAIGIERPVAAARAVELELVDAMAHPLLVAEAVSDVLANVQAVDTASVRELLAQ